MLKFDITIKCNKCGSTNVEYYTPAWETGISITCRNCRNMADSFSERLRLDAMGGLLDDDDV